MNASAIVIRARNLAATNKKENVLLITHHPKISLTQKNKFHNGALCLLV